MEQEAEVYEKTQFDAKQFYGLIQEYRLALFSSSPTDDCVYYIYVEPSKIHLEFCRKELCYILKVEFGEGDEFGGLMVKGAMFDCKIHKNDEMTRITFKSDMMEGETYLVLKK